MHRYSKKRTAIYECLRNTTTHPTADWIYQQLRPEYPDLSLATVYRNLTQLKDAGRIFSVGVVNGQERFDANLRPHSHLVCRSCGAVEDLPETGLPADLVGWAETATGWTVENAALRLTGLCPRCRGKNQ